MSAKADNDHGQSEKTEEEKRLEEEKRIEEAQARHKALVSVQESAMGLKYTEPIKTS